MLGRKNYTREELDHCKAAIGQQLAAYENLTKAMAPDNHANPILEAFELTFRTSRT